MDVDFILEGIRKMRPSAFSAEERHRYQAEKMMLRQFMLMKQQDQVPEYLSVRDMKNWLLRGRSFLQEFQGAFLRKRSKLLFVNELAWTTARHFCINQMEQELLEELSKERQLSQLFGRQVTLEGLQMFTSAVRPAAEEDVRSFLPSLHRQLLAVFGGDQAALSELERSTAALVPRVASATLRFLPGGAEQRSERQAASEEVGELLADAMAPCLSRFGPVSRTFLLGACDIAARFMVRAIYKTAVSRARSFRLMDYDESLFSAAEGVVSAVHNMCTPAHHHLCSSRRR